MAEKTEEEKGKRKLRRKIESVLSKLNPLSPLMREREIRGPEFGTESLTAKVSGTKLESYPIDQGQVFISKKDGKGYYQVSEPSLDEEEMETYRNLLQNFYFSLDPEAAVAEEPMKYLEGAIWDSAHELGLMDEVREKFSKYRYFLKRDGLGYGKLHIPMNDPRVEDISLTSFADPVRVVLRGHSELRWLETNIKFRSETEVRNYNQRIAQRLGENLTAASPIVNATTSEGHRMALTFGDEATHPGSAFSVRKHRESPLTLARLVENNTLSSLMAAYLWQTLEWLGFPLISGGIGAGKTTLANALLMSVNPKSKVATAEEDMELNLPEENWLTFHTRKGSPGRSTEHDIDLFNLTKAVMRHRPDYVTVGEVRGGEIQSLIHTVALGHGGCCTLHGGSVSDVLTRLRTEPLGLSEGEILLIWSISVLGETRLASGKVRRRVKEIYELNPTPEGNVRKTELFTYDPVNNSFDPDKIHELLTQSERLVEASEIRGTGEEGLREALEEKIEFLEERIEKKETDFDAYVKRISEFYGG